MDEDTSIIDTKTRNEKINKFLVKNKKGIISSVLVVIIIIISFYTYQTYNDKKREQTSDEYNKAIINFQSGDKIKTIKSLKEIIDDKDSTYSPLALYFIIDNNLVEDSSEINNLFDILIEKSSLEYEIKNLIIYKKALFNADEANELKLLNILNPLINSESVWKSHALHLIGEFFYDKGETQKAKDFFQKIILIENPNAEIKINAQRRLNRDLSD